MYKTTEITSAEIASDNPVHQRLLYPYTKAATMVTGHVLEIGCGWGRGLELLTKAASQYTGIDKNTELITALSAAYPASTFIAANIPPLSGADGKPLPDNTFDFIVTFQVIEHIENDDLFIREAHRVLKPGGKLLLTTVNKTFSLTRNPWHVREYTAGELKALINRYFKTVDTQGIHGNEKVMTYYEQNKASVQKLTRFDIFNLQYRLPRRLLQVPYDIMNRLNRNRLLQADGLAAEIDYTDYLTSSDPAGSLDFFYIATK
ncbi:MULTISPECIES: class I SAM-dependent methyltransferase [Spirosoma]|uniref:Class I SAM-dependent methyltransferase n=1 Tax=Spirosoma sordidisoli TaxID=2502893 RepID=A0A4Q2UP50_9BACT|nr:MULTISPECIES: class I SAM-dependent methyltransferase [Spirosoma]RYC71116.1 class I SAM-dependent methyltransferase [Spirosoma sordidisoli]